MEWTKSTLKMFKNNRILYQANYNFDEFGNNLRRSRNATSLPFEHPFNYMLAIGVGDINYGFIKCENKQLTKRPVIDSWQSNEFFIDWVRFYGESGSSLIGLQNDTDSSSPNREQSTEINNLVIILGSSIVILILAFVIILAFMFVRNRRNKPAQIPDVD